MTMKSSLKNDLPQITVKEEDDGSFTLNWDDTDPRLDFLSDWTEEDWIQAIKDGLSKDNGTETRQGLPEEISTKPGDAEGIAGKEATDP